MSDSLLPRDRDGYSVGKVRAAIRKRLEGHGATVLEEHPDRLVVEIDGEENTLFVGNITRALDAVPPDDVEEYLDQWVEKNLRPPFTDAEQESWKDLAQVREQLFPRVVAPAARGGIEDRCWTDRLVEGQLELALVIDLPDSVVYADDAMVHRWGVDGARDAAMENLRRVTTADDFKQLEGTHLRLCERTDSFAAARSLLLEEVLETTHGVFATVPGRDLLLAAPLTSEAINQIQHLYVLAQQYVNTLPYAISGELYWIHRGKWHHVPADHDGENVTITPPEPLVGVLQEIMED